MRDANETIRLMKYSANERTFIIDAMKYVGKKLEEHLYVYEGEASGSQLKVDIKDIFEAVFDFEESNGKSVVSRWHNHELKAKATFPQSVPDDFLNKTWEEIYEPMVKDPYKDTLLTLWLRDLEKEIKLLHYNARFWKELPYMKIWWND